MGERGVGFRRDHDVVDPTTASPSHDGYTSRTVGMSGCAAGPHRPRVACRLPIARVFSSAFPRRYTRQEIRSNLCTASWNSSPAQTLLSNRGSLPLNSFRVALRRGRFRRVGIGSIPGSCFLNFQNEKSRFCDPNHCIEACPYLRTQCRIRAALRAKHRHRRRLRCRPTTFAPCCIKRAANSVSALYGTFLAARFTSFSRREITFKPPNLRNRRR